MRTLWKRDLPIAAVLLLSLLSYFAWWYVSNETSLDRAQAAIQTGSYAEARANAKSVVENGLSSIQSDRAKLLYGQACIAELERHPEPELKNLLPTALAWLHQIETQEHFGTSRALLAKQNFYRQHQFDVAEAALREGLAVAPFQTDLFEMRLELLSLTGRWIEACERVPVDDLKKLPLPLRRQLLNRLTLATFFPDDFLLPLDRRLGLLSAQEQPNRNTPLARWKMMVNNHYAAPAGAMAQWYQDKGLQNLAWEILKTHRLAAEKTPTALFCEQMLLVQSPENRSPTLVQHLRNLSSPARWAHAQLWLSSDLPGSVDSLPWPLVADRSSLIQAQQRGIESDLQLQRLEYWQTDRRQDVLAATRDTTGEPQVLVECWTAFGREDIAALFHEANTAATGQW